MAYRKNRKIIPILIRKTGKLIARIFPAYLFLVTIAIPCKAQSDAGCSTIIKEADSLAEIKSYKVAAQLYFLAFNSIECKTNSNLLKAAKISLRAGLSDSTFKFLDVIISRKACGVYVSILSDPQFINLKHDPRWIRTKSILQIYMPTLEEELISLQADRIKKEKRAELLLKNYGTNSGRYKAYLDTVFQTDAINTFKIESMIRTHGWLGVDQIEIEGVRALLYLYLKLNFKDQKAYYPIMATGFKNGTIDPANFAIMTDKIALRDKGEQIYGTQSGTNQILLPIENPDSVNFRRAAVGLSPLNPI